MGQTNPCQAWIKEHFFNQKFSAPTKFTLPETGGSRLQYPGYIPQTGLRLSLYLVYILLGLGLGFGLGLG